MQPDLEQASSATQAAIQAWGGIIAAKEREAADAEEAIARKDAEVYSMKDNLTALRADLAQHKAQQAALVAVLPAPVAPVIAPAPIEALFANSGPVPEADPVPAVIPGAA